MTEKLFSDIFENYKRIIENIEKSKQKVGRTDNVRLMAVTKTVDFKKINYAVELGVNLLGENRVQEFLEKSPNYPPNAEVHFIGGLQKNKVKYIIDKVSLIHSVDKFSLIKEINARAKVKNKIMDILIEVNIAEEVTKNGVVPNLLDNLISSAESAENVRIRGFMAIPPPDYQESNKIYFKKMQEIFNYYQEKFVQNDKIKIDTLSMGMSGDYELAIEHGATIVRIGNSLFGKRNYI